MTTGFNPGPGPGNSPRVLDHEHLREQQIAAWARFTAHANKCEACRSAATTHAIRETDNVLIPVDRLCKVGAELL